MGYTPPYLDVRKVSGGWSVYSPSSTTTEDLTIYPNTSDSYAKLVLYGNEGATLYCNTGKVLRINEAAVEGVQIGYKAADNRAFFYCPVDAKDIALLTTGAGVLQFGTYTAGAATDSTGYITIKDALGNTRKLMVQA